MMKRLWALMMALMVLLCGCGQDETLKSSVVVTTEPTTAPIETPEDSVTQDYAGYLPDSQIEELTNGAIKVYELDGEGYRGVLLLGDSLLLLSGDEDTTLTALAPDGTSTTLALENQFLLPEDMTIISKRGAVAYYDFERQAMILLDETLKELQQVAMPEAMVGKPVVTPNWSLIYYFTEDALRCLDISTGIDRMLKQIQFSSQEIYALHFDGTLLQCLVMDDESFKTMMISGENGALMYESEDSPILFTHADRYFATHYDGGIIQNLFGTLESDILCLNVEHPLYLSSPELWAAVTCAETDSGVILSYYDLETGCRSSAVTLPAEYAPEWMIGDVQRNAIWFTMLDENFDTVLCRWDVASSETGETESYVSPYHTEDDPDVDGLNQLIQQADALGREYGIRIRIYEDAINVQPSDYTFEPEHSVDAYNHYLTILEEALAQYPDGFLKKLGSTSDNGKLTISLVGGAYGENSLGSLDSANGVHFYNDGDVYIALVMGDAFLGTLYHELFHAIDTYVLSHCNVYDDWEDLNPKGFEYDNDYVTNQFREDYQYLDEDRWFIDMYSMSYAKEDRARIMEYAMQGENEFFFESKHMQTKLQVLSKGIRKAFGLKNTQTLPWEQYLK